MTSVFASGGFFSATSPGRTLADGALYELLAGRLLFAGETTTDVLAAILTAEPAPPRNFNQAIPYELDRIVGKTLAKERAQRYQTADALLADLRRLQKLLEFEAEVERQYGSRPAGSSRSGPAKTPEVRNSIAVLPFANLSSEAENEYFCDGLAEELLNALAKIEDLRVAARTSAFSFKGKHTNVSEIGRALNVQTVLEGSVRRSGNRLRINVQLVNAAGGYHLWSERYDRELQDIFDVQDEIALAVVDALKVKLLGQEEAALLKRHTNNADAYLWYLRGQYFRWKTAPAEFRKCRDYFQRAVDADPAFALGYFGLDSYYGYGAAWGILPPDEGWPKAEAAIAKTLELDDTLPEVHLALAAHMLVYRRDWAGAEREIKRTANLHPKFAEIHHLYSFYLVALGRFDEAIAEGERALALDPLSVSYSRFLGTLFYFARRPDAAVEQHRQALELDPHNAPVRESLGDAYELKGLHGEAVAEWQRAMTLAGDEELATILGRAYAGGDYAGAVRAVARKRLARFDARVARGEYVPAIDYARLHQARQ